MPNSQLKIERKQKKNQHISSRYSDKGGASLLAVDFVLTTGGDRRPCFVNPKKTLKNLKEKNNNKKLFSE